MGVAHSCMHLRTQVALHTCRPVLTCTQHVAYGYICSHMRSTMCTGVCMFSRTLNRVRMLTRVNTYSHTLTHVHTFLTCARMLQSHERTCAHTCMLDTRRCAHVRACTCKMRAQAVPCSCLGIPASCCPQQLTRAAHFHIAVAGGLCTLLGSATPGRC